MKTTTKEKNPDKVGFGTLLLWTSSGASQAVQMVLFGLLTIYCTNALGMDAALVGTLLLGTKIVDGVVDLFYGYAIDRTNTKLGRGRPYELMIIGLWVTTWLLFSVPASATIMVKSIWVVVCYTLCQSVFKSFLSISGTPYMVRAFNNEQKYIKLNSWGGLLTTAIIMIFNIVSPMLYAPIVNNAAGWSRLVLFLAIPCAIIGMLRFFFVPERYQVEVTTEKVRLKDVITVLKTNHNIYPVAVMTLVTTMMGAMPVTSYYFLYIVKDLAISGVLSFFQIIAMLTLIFYPMILKKLSVKRFIQLSLMLSVVYAIVAFLAGSNLIALAIAGIILGMCTLAPSYLGNLLVIECADYNEYRGQQRMEGTLTSITSFFNNCGSAFGSFVLGVLLSAAGFDGTKQVQPDSAIFMIRFIYAILPAIFMVIAALILQGYKIDKMKPEITAAIAAKQAKLNAANESDAADMATAAADDNGGADYLKPLEEAIEVNANALPNATIQPLNGQMSDPIPTSAIDGEKQE